MSSSTTGPAHHGQAPHDVNSDASEALPPGCARHPVRHAVGRAAIVAAVFAVAGAAGGWLWETLWTPPTGEVVDGRWLYDSYVSIGRVFGATGWYAVVGLAGGAVLAVLVGSIFRRSELGVLAGVMVGSVVAAWLSYRVGMQLSPPDPVRLAATAADGTSLPGQATITGHSPFVAWPLGALLGLGVTYVLTAGASAGVAEWRRVEIANAALGERRDVDGDHASPDGGSPTVEPDRLG
ncbi:hypothetical protein [Nocardioides sp. R-C-SC26]|uniref:hypothetical protein n=1 Tax=Nocardioides sp. R-C-SC26 TaxID=2870414 RepID=UPI001E505CDC|nr:hypothetical protein [Nocardioides sp. R-C-SC26]